MCISNRQILSEWLWLQTSDSRLHYSHLRPVDYFRRIDPIAVLSGCSLRLLINSLPMKTVKAKWRRLATLFLTRKTYYSIECLGIYHTSVNIAKIYHNIRSNKCIPEKCTLYVSIQSLKLDTPHLARLSTTLNMRWWLDNVVKKVG